MATSKQQQEPQVSWPKYSMNEDTFKSYVKRHDLYLLLITGQQTVTYKEFRRSYAPAIRHAVENPVSGKKPLIMMGAAQGVDSMAAHFLEKVLNYPYVVIFDKHDKNGNEALAKGWGLRNGYEDFNKRDNAMIKLAEKIIVYLFKDALGSGTHFNLLKFLELNVPSSLLGSEGWSSFFFSFERILDRSSEWASNDWKLDETKAVRSDDDKFQQIVKFVLASGFFGYQPAAGDCLCGKCSPKNKPSDDNNSSAAATNDSSKKLDSKPIRPSVQARVDYAKSVIEKEEMSDKMRAFMMALVDAAAEDVETELADKELAKSDDEIPDLVDSDSEVVNNTSVPSQQTAYCDCAKCAAKRESRR
jgi:hypothetical protein